MAKPQGDFADVAGGLEHHDGVAVPQLMRGDGAPGQLGVIDGSSTRVFVEDVFEPGPGHRSALGVYEEFRDAGGSTHRQPCPQITGCFLPKREGPLLAAFSVHTDAGCPMQGDVRQRKAHQFGDAQPAGEAKAQHGTVPGAKPRRRVRGVEDCSHCVHCKAPRQGLVMALCRNGVDLHDLLQGSGDAELDMAHEGLDRGEPGVAGRSTIATLLLDVGQEAEHEGRVDVFEAELRGSLPHTFAGKDEQQPKGVRVALAGVGLQPRSADGTCRSPFWRAAAGSSPKGTHGRPPPAACSADRGRGRARRPLWDAGGRGDAYRTLSAGSAALRWAADRQTGGPAPPRSVTYTSRRSG